MKNTSTEFIEKLVANAIAAEKLAGGDQTKAETYKAAFIAELRKDAKHDRRLTDEVINAVAARLA